MTFAWQDALAATIGGIGDRDFAGTMAGALRRAAGFDLAAAIRHRRDADADLLFDDLTPAGYGEGIRNYVRVTHRINPMLHPAPALGAVRARDFALPSGKGGDRPAGYLVWSRDEEMGFRTQGWPASCEEIGLYIATSDGIVELSFYRPRARAAFPASDMRALGALAPALRAAFDRHRQLCPDAPGTPALSARERDVHALMVAGCSTEAIALRLEISRHTVKDHRKRIFRKLGVGTLAELFAMARGPR